MGIFWQAGAAEGLLWIVVGVFMLVGCAEYSGQRHKKLHEAAGALFVLFGLADIAGAWLGSGSAWLPAWKGLNAAAVFFCLVRIIYFQRKGGNGQGPIL